MRPSRCFLVLALLPATILAQPEAGSMNVGPSINELGLDLYRAQSRSAADSNLLLSPYSISTALVMTCAGADGDTRAEMQRVLHLPNEDDRVQAGFAAFARDLDAIETNSNARLARVGTNGGPTTPIEINVANRAFVQHGFVLREPFTRVLRDRYGAPCEELDFKHAAEQARATINTWVARETRDKIRDIVPPGTINESTRLALANAIYLRAPWANPFEPAATRNEPFFVRGRESVPVPTMSQHGSFRYETRDGFAAIALSYDGEELQFVILLPDDRTGLEQIERNVSVEALARCTRMPRRDVVLHLPKFKIEPPTIPLGELLIALGMPSAFDRPRGSANFNRMAPRLPDAYLAISDVLHKIWLALDENGTEAAAATVVVAFAASMVPREQPPPVEVRVDRPFLFAIQHVASGACLFLGRVTDPR